MFCALRQSCGGGVIERGNDRVLIRGVSKVTSAEDIANLPVKFAAGIEPLRVRVQRAVNQLMYGQRDDPYGVLARFGHQLESALTPNLVLPAVARTIGETLKLPYVAIALRSGDDQQVVAEYRGARGAAEGALRSRATCRRRRRGRR